MKNLLALLFILLALHPAKAETALDMADFRQIPVLHEGRVKPLESFARTYLLILSGKTALKGLPAINWLAETLFDPEKAYVRPVFNIANPEVTAAIGLTWRENHMYAFQEVSDALSKYSGTIAAIGRLNKERQTPAQRQLMELFYKAVAFATLTQSLTLVQPRFEIIDAATANALHVQPGKLAYVDLLPAEQKILSYGKALLGRNPENLSKLQRQRAVLAAEYALLSQHKRATLLRIVPPLWAAQGDNWTAPWETLLQGNGAPQSAAYLNEWKKLAAAYAGNDAAAWKETSREILDQAFDLAGERASPLRLKLEVLYHALHPFETSLSLYFIGFALAAGFLLRAPRHFHRMAFAITAGGAFLHGCGILTRTIIMQRPPVATLYETTLFVSLIAILLALIFERRRKDGAALACGALIGAFLLFISTRYAADGDTMEMLVAVLNTNFWLATHVLAVTTGYACALLAGCMGHVFLLKRIFQPHDANAQQKLNGAITAIALVALLFALTGTILGGIWADQSWGRFWGWDPKENGALLVVLWLLWLLHGKVAGMLNPLNFATGMVVTNIIVALAWFGVNLLSVGLHSYGFTSSIAANLGLFCFAELLFIAITRAYLAKRRLT